MLLAGSPVVTDQDIFRSEREMLLDPLYADLDNHGFRWWAAIGFMSGSALWGLSLQRTKQEGQFEAPELAALSQLSRRLSDMTRTLAISGMLITGACFRRLSQAGKMASSAPKICFVVFERQNSLTGSRFSGPAAGNWLDRSKRPRSGMGHSRRFDPVLSTSGFHPTPDISLHLGRSRRDRPAPLLALLLDRPEPVGFVLVGIISGRRRDQPRAFFTEMIETTTKLAACQRVPIVGPVSRV